MYNKEWHAFWSKESRHDSDHNYKSESNAQTSCVHISDASTYGTSQYRSSGSLISTYPLFTFTVPVFIGLRYPEDLSQGNAPDTQHHHVRPVCQAYKSIRHVWHKPLAKNDCREKKSPLHVAPMSDRHHWKYRQRKIGKPASMRRSPIINVHDMDYESVFPARMAPVG